MQLDTQQPQFREQEQHVGQSTSRLSPFETTIAQALSSRGQTPAAVTGLGKPQERRNVTKEQRTGHGSGRVSPQPATSTTNPLVAALPVVEPRTLLTVIEDKCPFDVAELTSLPAKPHNLMACAPATGPASPAKPTGNAGWGGFPGPAAQLATAYCSAGCMIEGEGSELTWTHRVPFLRSEGEPIQVVLPPSPEPQPSKLKKIYCPYCEASMYIALDDCRDFNKKFPPRQNTTNRPPISSTISIPRSDRMDEASEEGWMFSGYDRPRSTRGRITEGNGGEGGRIPPRGGKGLGEEKVVIPTPLPIVTTPTPHLSIPPKSLVVVRTTRMSQGRRSMTNA